MVFVFIVIIHKLFIYVYTYKTIEKKRIKGDVNMSEEADKKLRELIGEFNVENKINEMLGINDKE
jgi:hypothetical protein